MVLASPSVYGKPPQPRAASERATPNEVVPPTANGSSRSKAKAPSKTPTAPSKARSKSKGEAKKASRATTNSTTVATRRNKSAKPVARPDLFAFAAPAETRGKGAKPKPKAKKKPNAKAGKQPKRRSGAGDKVSIEEEFLIEGKLEKPSAYYILRRSQGDYDWARLDAKFLPLVLESVQDPLF